MKTKYSSNKELIHIWANNNDSSVYKSANSVSCQNDILFSYSTAIGQIIDDDTVIYNTASYSNTTSKHQGLMHYSTGHYLNRIYLDIHKYGLNNLILNQRDFDELIVKPNLHKGSELLLKASRSKLYKDRYNAAALDIFDNVEKYAKLFGLYCIMPNTDALLETIIKHDKEAKALEKIRRAERIEDQKLKLIDWRNGVDIRVNFEVTALRIKDDVIETTKGARIPLDHAIKFWSLINSWHKKGMTYIKDGHSIHLGNYCVNRFEKDVLTVGCHQIPYSEIQNIANQLHLEG